MDRQVILVACIAALPGTIAATAALIQATEAKHQAIETHKSVNSRMDTLLLLATAKATAEATLVEKAAEQDRQDAKDTKGKR